MSRRSIERFFPRIVLPQFVLRHRVSLQALQLERAWQVSTTSHVLQEPIVRKRDPSESSVQAKPVTSQQRIVQSPARNISRGRAVVPVGLPDNTLVVLGGVFKLLRGDAAVHKLVDAFDDVLAGHT